MNMVYVVATKEWSGWLNCVGTWTRNASRPHYVYVVKSKPIMEAYQQAFEHTHQEIISLMHDDLEVYEKNWDERVLREFEDPTVGCVGFAGARRHGRPDIYVSPYDLPQLGRFGFMSNIKEAEQHGTRFSGVCDVAVLDGMAMFVRRSVLEKCGGWPVGTPINYFCYDYWLCCEVRRQGYRIRLVGVDCHHIGGRTALMSALPDSHAEAHKWLYDRSSDVLPFEVK